MKKRLLSGVLAVALGALFGAPSTGVSAQPASELWSIAVHIRYPSGFIYAHVFATGVPTSELPSILEDCASSHWVGSPIQYHCYPIPE